MPKNYMAEQVTNQPMKHKGKMKLSNVHIQILDDGTYLCEKSYSQDSGDGMHLGMMKSKKSSHPDAKDLVNYLGRIFNEK